MITLQPGDLTSSYLFYDAISQRMGEEASPDQALQLLGHLGALRLSVAHTPLLCAALDSQSAALASPDPVGHPSLLSMFSPNLCKLPSPKTWGSPLTPSQQLPSPSLQEASRNHYQDQIPIEIESSPVAACSSSMPLFLNLKERVSWW